MSTHVPPISNPDANDHAARDAAGETSAEQLIWLVRRFRQAMAGTLAAQGNQPIPPAAKWLLLAVNRRPGTIGELSQRLGVTKQAVSHMADTLVARGCCDRLQRSDDRREVILSATPEGTRLARVLLEAIDRAESELLSGLTPQRRTAFHQILTELAASG